MAYRKRTLIYLHGLNSSGKADKPQILKAYIEQNKVPIDYLSPDLHNLPDLAMQQIEKLLDEIKDSRPILIGSSLGGFYATHLSQIRDIPAVLINPAVRPHELLANYLGHHQNPYTKVNYELTASHTDTLKSFYHDTIKNPQHILVLLQMGDEVLNAHEACQHFMGSQCIITPAGDHRFKSFSTYSKLIIDWLLAID